MIIGIDASNIRIGGGVTHLVEFLRAAEPGAYSFSRVIVWGGAETLNRIEERPWLIKAKERMLDRSLPFRMYWQKFVLSKLARSAGCAVLFVPGGAYSGDFRPIVTMSRNLLPFEWRELRRFGYSMQTLKMIALRSVQARTFRRADGMIFLNAYAKAAVLRVTKRESARTAIIPHGVHGRFTCAPRPQLAIEAYTPAAPFRLLYVSTVDVFKHQWVLAEAVARLRRLGMPVSLDLVGPAYAPALEKLKRTMHRVDPTGEFITYCGPLPYTELHRKYADAALCVFASSCENMPNILLEGMASGLPIACSNRGPMPEILGDGGMYFDPENVDHVETVLKEMISRPHARAAMAKIAFERARAYSWKRCASETLQFIAEVARAPQCRSPDAREPIARAANELTVGATRANRAESSESAT